MAEIGRYWVPVLEATAGFYHTSHTSGTVVATLAPKLTCADFPYDFKGSLYNPILLESGFTVPVWIPIPEPWWPPSGIWMNDYVVSGYDLGYSGFDRSGDALMMMSHKLTDDDQDYHNAYGAARTQILSFTNLSHRYGARDCCSCPPDHDLPSGLFPDTLTLTFTHPSGWIYWKNYETGDPPWDWDPYAIPSSVDVEVVVSGFGLFMPRWTSNNAGGHIIPEDTYSWTDGARSGYWQHLLGSNAELQSVCSHGYWYLTYGPGRVDPFGSSSYFSLWYKFEYKPTPTLLFMSGYEIAWVGTYWWYTEPGTMDTRRMDQVKPIAHTKPCSGELTGIYTETAYPWVGSPIYPSYSSTQYYDDSIPITVS